MVHGGRRGEEGLQKEGGREGLLKGEEGFKGGAEGGGLRVCEAPLRDPFVGLKGLRSPPCTSTESDSDNEPLMAMSVASRPTRAEAVEAFDLTIVDSDLSEAPRVRARMPRRKQRGQRFRIPPFGAHTG